MKGNASCISFHGTVWKSLGSKLSAQAAPVFPLLPCMDLVGFGLLCFWVFDVPAESNYLHKELLAAQRSMLSK